ncbi:MAG: hypothetical protein NTZ09_05280 [Candidatus Hydrogenedentes bacterium]|nr:hypothetical protein [Candidatus Hydrogenedentota bacterium]
MSDNQDNKQGRRLGVLRRMGAAFGLGFAVSRAVGAAKKTRREKKHGALSQFGSMLGRLPELVAAYLAASELQHAGLDQLPRSEEAGPVTGARVEVSIAGPEWVVPGKHTEKLTNREPEKPAGSPGALEPELDRVERPRRPYWPWVWAVMFLVGVLGWILTVLFGAADRAWQAVLVNFLYFTPMATGMVTWTAVVTASRGTWMGETKSAGLMGISFWPASLVGFAWAWIGWPHWAGWIHYSDLENTGWVNTPFIFVRDAICLIAIWLVAWLYVRQARQDTPRPLAGGLILIYCLGFSLLGFDLVMTLDPHWGSSLFGGYFFVSGMYIGLAAWTLLAIVRQPSAHLTPVADLAKLLVAFSILTTYMMYAQLLPIWYENLPDEVRYVIPRLQITPWRWVSVALLALIYLGPLVFLLPRRVKKSVRYVGAASALILAVMWFERYWLVAPTLGRPLVFGFPEIFATAVFTGAFLFPISLRNRRLPIVTVRRRDGP